MNPPLFLTKNKPNQTQFYLPPKACPRLHRTLEKLRYLMGRKQNGYKLEEELRKTLKAEPGFCQGKGESRRKEMNEMKGLFERFVNNTQRARLVFWIFFGVSLIIMFTGLSSLFKLSNPNELAVALFVALVGFNSTILMKLWYWTMNTKFDLLKELKQLELQIAGLSGEKPSPED